MKTSDRFALKGIVIGLIGAGRRCRREMQKTVTRQAEARQAGAATAAVDVRERVMALAGLRCSWRGDKERVGGRTRMYLLAWGLLRGRAYREIEPGTEPANMPSAAAIRETAGQFFDYEDAKRWPDAKAVEAWLEAPEPEAHKAAREAAEKEGRLQAALRRAEAFRLRHAPQPSAYSEMAPAPTPLTAPVP